MKAILLSIKPEWLVKILNGEKTIEVRKKFPKDYVGWVYIYCTKAKKKYDYLIPAGIKWEKQNDCSGKVVARFWCGKVDKWDIWQKDLEEKVKLACLSIKEFDDYSKGQVAYAIHISKLEIFDRPRELKHFYYCKTFHRSEPDEEGRKTFKALIQLSKAPQNMVYIEEE